MRALKISLFIFGFVFLAAGNSFAQKITVLYTGQTHAMLYPCSCPIQQDGGIARRAALVKELRKKDPQLLLLDCGNFTAGGLMDEYTQSVQLDTQRTLVNYKAMEFMRYDAVAVGSEEFNFGKDFFLKNARRSGPAYLSANLDTDKVLPYITKDINGVKIGIIGLTGLSARQKAEGLKINSFDKAAELVKRLRDEGAQVVILLSTLGEKEDLKLLSLVKGIDILFTGQNPLSEEPLTRIGNTFLLRPSWQGRKLGKLSLEVSAGKLVDCKAEQLRLSDKIGDDPAITAILPRCYSDSNCKKEATLGTCQNPGTPKASCSFKDPNKIDLLVISSKDCLICSEQPVISALKKKFPGITERYLYYPDQQAKERIEELAILGLPAYILGEEIEKEDKFLDIKNDLLQVKGGYLLKPQAAGLAYFFSRKIKKGNLDLFLSLFDKDAPEILAVTEEFKPVFHFLVTEKGDGFEAKGGNLEVEESLRGVCAQKYYPQKFSDYLVCRSKNINSSYWEDCLPKTGIQKIKECARGPEGVKLLKENISLNNQLQIYSGPAYLLDNREIFSSRGAPAKEELRKIIKK